MWLRHWKLSRNPFAENERAYVATPSHDEAVARLLHAIEGHERSATLVAPPGAGKSTVLARALALAKSPTRRVAVASSPHDGALLFMTLAAQLGQSVDRDASRTVAWRQLAEAVRLCHWQRQAVVLVVDDAHGIAAEIERLMHLEAGPNVRLTVLVVGREHGCEPLTARAGDRWELAIRLRALTRAEGGDYVARKLALAGRDALTFTDRALTRLHALSSGLPRGLNRLASLALMAGAVRGVEAITPEIVEGAAHECAGESFRHTA